MIARLVYDTIRAHAEETYPCECCGVLYGQPLRDGADEAWSITEFAKATNMRADSAHNRYSIAPVELVKLAHEARQKGLEIAGFYHSHPDHHAEWSLTDLAEAHWIGCCYVITEVTRGRVAVTNSFLLAGTTEQDKRFELQTIQVEN